ncbi:MAG: YgjV family protein [Hyphomicrobiales bacterium]|nr:YgjV family protein [Hyphomicrobiales bacterium]
MDFLSPAQLVGYVAFALGVTAFLQRSDRRLKLLNAAQSLAYAAHFLLLGNVAAAASAVISSVRSLLATRWRSAWLAVFFVVFNVGVGVRVATAWTGWLPVIASSLSTIAIFLMQGVRMRLTIFVATLLWLANNILSGSIGGTTLEAFIAVANLSTIVRMIRRPNAS